MNFINPRPNRSLHLETYEGTPIDNSIDPDPAPNVIAYQKQSIPFIRFIKELNGPTGRYNCHGLVFASRRTNVDGPNHPANIDEILRSDRFQSISNDPEVGDIIVYRNKATREIEHTGFVNRIENIGGQLMPFIWSKWGALGEYEHQVMECVYYDDCNIEYWRLKT